VYGLEASPCDRISARGIIGRREPRQRVLNEAELRMIWEATESLRFPFGPFIQLLLITEQRRAEVSDTRWSEINLDAALWTIASERMKGGIAHEVPLSGTALDLIKSAPRFNGPFVFSTTSGARPISGFSKMKARLDAVMPDVAPWRLHDLRRTVRTGLVLCPSRATYANWSLLTRNLACTESMTCTRTATKSAGRSNYGPTSCERL
jgi:integrase